MSYVPEGTHCSWTFSGLPDSVLYLLSLSPPTHSSENSVSTSPIHSLDVCQAKSPPSLLCSRHLEPSFQLLWGPRALLFFLILPSALYSTGSAPLLWVTPSLPGARLSPTAPLLMYKSILVPTVERISCVLYSCRTCQSNADWPISLGRK